MVVPSGGARSGDDDRMIIPDERWVMYDSYIMTLTRTQISLSDDDRRVLDAVSRRTGRSMSALIRDAIHATYGRGGELERIESALEATFGVVSAEEDGREMVDRLRTTDRLRRLA